MIVSSKESFFFVCVFCSRSTASWCFFFPRYLRLLVLFVLLVDYGLLILVVIFILHIFLLFVLLVLNLVVAATGVEAALVMIVSNV